jgi:hypothetical protein
MYPLLLHSSPVATFHLCIENCLLSRFPERTAHFNHGPVTVQAGNSQAHDPQGVWGTPAMHLITCVRLYHAGRAD